MQLPELEYPDLYDYLTHPVATSERATQFLVFLVDFLAFFLKRLRRATNSNQKETDC